MSEEPKSVGPPHWCTNTSTCEHSAALAKARVKWPNTLPRGLQHCCRPQFSRQEDEDLRSRSGPIETTSADRGGTLIRRGCRARELTNSQFCSWPQRRRSMSR
jgi:hypothetical protein